MTRPFLIWGVPSGHGAHHSTESLTIHQKTCETLLFLLNLSFAGKANQIPGMGVSFAIYKVFKPRWVAQPSKLSFKEIAA
jgi:hypothetical protein